MRARHYSASCPWPRALHINRITVEHYGSGVRVTTADKDQAVMVKHLRPDVLISGGAFDITLIHPYTFTKTYLPAHLHVGPLRDGQIAARLVCEKGVGSLRLSLESQRLGPRKHPTMPRLPKTTSAALLAPEKTRPHRWRQWAQWACFGALALTVIAYLCWPAGNGCASAPCFRQAENATPATPAATDATTHGVKSHATP